MDHVNLTCFHTVMLPCTISADGFPMSATVGRCHLAYGLVHCMEAALFIKQNIKAAFLALTLTFPVFDHPIKQISRRHQTPPRSGAARSGATFW